MRCSLRQLLGLVAFAAIVIAILTWGFRLPAKTTWRTSGQIWEDYFAGPHFHIAVSGVGSSEPIAGYVVRVDDPSGDKGVFTPKMLREWETHRNHRVSDNWRRDFVLLASDGTKGFVKIELDRNTAKEWFVGRNPPIEDHDSCTRFWDTYVLPELAIANPDT